MSLSTTATTMTPIGTSTSNEGQEEEELNNVSSVMLLSSTTSTTNKTSNTKLIRNVNVNGKKVTSALLSQRRREERITQQLAEECVNDASNIVSDILASLTSKNLGTITNTSIVTSTPHFRLSSQSTPISSSSYYYDDNIDDDNNNDNVTESIDWLRDSDYNDDNNIDTDEYNVNDDEFDVYGTNDTINTVATPAGSLSVQQRRQQRSALGSRSRRGRLGGRQSHDNRNTPMMKYNSVTKKKHSDDMDRAATPIMSNATSSSSAYKDYSTAATRNSTTTTTTPYNNNKSDYNNDSIDNNDFLPSVNVQSPWDNIGRNNFDIEQSPGNTLQGTRTPTTTRRSSRSSYTQQDNNINNQNKDNIENYYNTVCSFVHAKRNLYEQIGSTLIEQQQQQQQQTSTNTNTTTVLTVPTNTKSSSYATTKECYIDMEFLRQLQTIAYNRINDYKTGDKINTDHLSSSSSPQEEGNFWYLLIALRSLGTSAIVWDDTSTTTTTSSNSMQTDDQYRIYTYLQQLASSYIEITPYKLVTDFNNAIREPTTTNTASSRSSTRITSSPPPFILQRRQRIVDWLEYCLNHNVTPYVNASVSAAATGSTKSGMSSSSSHSSSILTNRISILKELNINEQQYHKHLAIQGFSATVNDTELLSDCLLLILAGRLHDAQQLARNCNESWRAALWDGSTPHGYAIDNDNNNSSSSVPSTDTTLAVRKQKLKSIGNPKRALWKTVTWKLANTKIETSNHQNQLSCNDYELAIAAILSSNIQSALNNPVITKSWDQCMYVLYRSMTDRTIDELLHIHNTYRRRHVAVEEKDDTLNKIGFNKYNGFPGIIEYEQYEYEHLQATAIVASLTDKTAIELVRTRAAIQNQNQQIVAKENNLIIQAASTILIGISSYSTYMDTSLHKIETMDVSYLIFMTHLALYLDSLSINFKGTNSQIFNDVSTWKNELLIYYIDWLSRYVDLRYMMIVYASLLPEMAILDVLPKHLISVESSKERRVIVHQLLEFLTIRRSGLDLDILRRLVRIVLFTTNYIDNDDNDEEQHTNIRHFNKQYDETSITHLDMRKMKVILWLTHLDEHVGDALIAANILLRQFLLYEGYDDDPNEGRDKLYEANILVNEILPRDLLDRVVSIHTNQMMMFDNDDETAADSTSITKGRLIQIDRAQSDFVAVQVYLAAMEAWQEWFNLVSKTSPTKTNVELDDSTTLSRLNESEQKIANKLVERNILEEKRNTTSTIVAAADKAETAFLEILKYDGGWLLTDDEVETNKIVDDDDDDNEEAELVRRLVEMKKLRAIIIPTVINLYGNICTATARWMYSSLNYTTEKFQEIAHRTGATKPSRNQVVTKLDDSNTQQSGIEDGSYMNSSPVLPQYWTEKLVDLAQICATETYGINSAFENIEDYENVLQMLAENAIAHLQYVEMMD